MNNFVQIPATKRSLALRKPLFGIGINDASYIVCPIINGKTAWCPFYSAWSQMITRCYSQKSQENKPAYIGCSVSKEWIIFSVFRSWMKAQNWEGKQLDKDLLIPGNKEYGPEACIFVSGAINSLLNESAASRGSYPQGVSFHKRDDKYQAQCKVLGKTKFLGYFTTVSAAEYEYLMFKSDLIKKIASESEAASNQKLKAGLLRYSELFKLKGDLICQ